MTPYFYLIYIAVFTEVIFSWIRRCEKFLIAYDDFYYKYNINFMYTVLLR